MLLKVTLVVLLLYFTTVAANEDGPEVTISQGVLKGKFQKTNKGKPFASFTGIPYAKPPVGLLRFKAPANPEPWDGIFDATRPHNACPQASPFEGNFTVFGEEDCLYLNVYTPQLPDEEKLPLPVMFYIHGGGFQVGTAGSNFYGPELLLNKDVVLVTANYRLGMLGFATLGNEMLPGNNGLKDQSFAIRWARNNIAQFGGDPEKITVFGQSSGGASAQYHMIAPMSRKHIKGVIAQSGNALSVWALGPSHIVGRRTKIVSGLVGCPAFKLDKMMECLMEVDAHDIVEQTKVFLETDMDPLLPFKPVIEPPIVGSFLAEDPIDIIKSKKMADIPMMTGITTDDGAYRTANLFKHPEVLEKLNKDFLEHAPTILQYGEISQIQARDKLSKQIKKFYFKGEKIDESNKDMFTKLYTDVSFLMGADASVEIHAKYLSKPVYYYLFDYRASSSSFCDIFDASHDYGVCHSDDLIHLFTSDFFPNYKPTESDKKVTELMLTLWTNFAKYGDPTPSTDSTISVKWKPVQTGKQNYLHIKSGSEIELREGLLPERTKFWRDFPVDTRRERIRDEL